jgi:hypothetical protein
LRRRRAARAGDDAERQERAGPAAAGAGVAADTIAQALSTPFTRVSSSARAAR